MNKLIDIFANNTFVIVNRLIQKAFEFMIRNHQNPVISAVSKFANLHTTPVVQKANGIAQNVQTRCNKHCQADTYEQIKIWTKT